MTSELDPGHRLPQEPIEPEPPTPPRRGGGNGLDEPDGTRLLWLVVGAAAIAGGTALGWDSTALASVVTPPPAIRALLVGSSFALGIVLLLSAVGRLSGFAEEPVSVRPTDERDIAGMIRGVRLVFLAVAAFAASSGWALGHPLPLVVALVIAGVDVLETSFLLVVVGLRRR